MSDRDLQARQYLLGNLTEAEVERFEGEYFVTPDALEFVEAAEEQLIDEYLEDTLSAADRQRFETHYLASPEHRDRVETIRRLRMAAHTSNRASQVGVRTFALAAAVVIAVAGLAWFVVERGRGTSQAPQTARVAQTPPIVPRVFAMSLSPVTVRGANDIPALVVPAGTDVVDLRLESEGPGQPIASGRVVIRTVDGRDVWRGPIATAGTLQPGIVAHAEVPAAHLVPDDYVITLFEIRPAAAELERGRYFLRVRR